MELTREPPADPAATVLVAAPAARVASLAGPLRALGLRVLEAPVVATAPAEVGGELDQALAGAPFDWVAFTSPRGVDAVAARCLALGVPAASLARRTAAVGPATAAAARAAGFVDPAVPPEFETEAIPQVMGPLEGARVLLARADVAPDALDRELAALGARVTRVSAYRTYRAEAGVDAREAAEARWVVFTSASAVRFLAQELGAPAWAALRARATALCIGRVTADAASGAGFGRVLAARPHTEQALVSLVREEVGPHG
ncbi:MAG TPA: uroporphyrinogen-III synthase [Candidatus Thermoplasmatota archaeon]